MKFLCPFLFTIIPLPVVFSSMKVSTFLHEKVVITQLNVNNWFYALFYAKWLAIFSHQKYRIWLLNCNITRNKLHYHDSLSNFVMGQKNYVSDFPFSRGALTRTHVYLNLQF